jgi:hypothetical protein
MSNTPQQLLAAEFELLRAEVIAAYQGSMEAGGNWAESVTIQPAPAGYSITAADYINGRSPGKPPPSEAIEAWINQKGIASRLEKNMTVSSLAFLIARKIAREGWQPKPGNGNSIDGVVTPQRIQHILDKVGESYLANLTTQITNYLNQIAL